MLAETVAGMQHGGRAHWNASLPPGFLADEGWGAAGQGNAQNAMVRANPPSVPLSSLPLSGIVQLGLPSPSSISAALSVTLAQPL